jgi:NitT/TauT family transport system ATP-binding protein
VSGSSGLSVAESAVPESRGQILASELRKIYDYRGTAMVAVDHLTLAIQPGEFVAIIGPSGCGKTTFLNMVAGFEEPTAGVIKVDGAAIAGPGPERGVVFQEYALFPWLNVLANVRYGLLERGMPKKQATEVAHKWLEQVGLDGFGDRYPHQLSGGMRQRVALVRVLANEPKILLMDEPFAALDAMTRSLLQKELLSLWQRSHQTVLFVTHNVEEAIYLADRMVIMSRRPNAIREVVTIDLPRPRDVTSTQFNDYRRSATGLLDAVASSE